MSHYYYATYTSTPKWVAIFRTQRERDEWVSFQDAVSCSVFDGECRAAAPRIALTSEQAYVCVGSRLYNKAKQIVDEFMENVHWAYDSSLDRRAKA